MCEWVNHLYETRYPLAIEIVDDYLSIVASLPYSHGTVLPKYQWDSLPEGNGQFHWIGLREKSTVNYRFSPKNGVFLSIFP